MLKLPHAAPHRAGRQENDASRRAIWLFSFPFLLGWGVSMLLQGLFMLFAPNSEEGDITED